VRTRREGGDVVVTWRTEFPARRTRFVVTGTERRRLRYPDDIAYASADGRQRTSFRVRLPHRRGLRVNWVTVTAASTEYGGRPRDVVVPVAR
jgi:hypothetical protein